MILLFVAAAASFADYVKAQSLVCVGPFDGIATPETRSINGKTYKLSGHKLSVVTRDVDDEIRFGVISATKDWSGDTRENVSQFVDWFRTENVEWLVLNGDLADDEEDLEEMFDWLGSTGFGVLVQIGNYESRGSYYRAVAAAAKKHQNLVDQNLVRVVEADDVTIVSMPGYFDRRFLHTGSGCLYKPEEVEKTLDVAETIQGPKLLISHGPPRCKGVHGIDVIADGRVNVGDPALAKLVKQGDFAFGIFGHIIESGGRGVVGDFSTPAPQEAWHSKLYINAGSANALPFGLLDGSTVKGSAALYVIKGGKARFSYKSMSARR